MGDATLLVTQLNWGTGEGGERQSSEGHDEGKWRLGSGGDGYERRRET